MFLLDGHPFLMKPYLEELWFETLRRRAFVHITVILARKLGVGS